MGVLGYMVTLFFWKWKRRNIQKFQNEGKAKVMGGVENLINNVRSHDERKRERERDSFAYCSRNGTSFWYYLNMKTKTFDQINKKILVIRYTI